MSAGRAFTGIDVERHSRCDAPSAGRGGGRGGFHVDRRPLRGPSVWGELQSSGPSAPWRRWISYRRRCQHQPITNQMHTHTQTNTHLHRGEHDNKDLVENDVQQNIVSSLFSYIYLYISSGGFCRKGPPAGRLIISSWPVSVHYSVPETQKGFRG